MTDETRSSDGCDACDGFLHKLALEIPTPSEIAVTESAARGVGVYIGGSYSENPANASHPSLERRNGIPDPSPPVTEPPPAQTPAGGDLVWLLSADGVKRNATPYRILGLDHGIGHLASMNPHKMSDSTPIDVETRGRPRHP